MLKIDETAYSFLPIATLQYGKNTKNVTYVLPLLDFV